MSRCISTLASGRQRNFGACTGTRALPLVQRQAGERHGKRTTFTGVWPIAVCSARELIQRNYDGREIIPSAAPISSSRRDGIVAQRIGTPRDPLIQLLVPGGLLPRQKGELEVELPACLLVDFASPDP